MHELFGEPVSGYSRAQAIEDGNLVDVTNEARETGFRLPVAITRAAWEDCIAWTDKDTKRKKGALQDERGRLHDVLWMGYLGARRAGAFTSFAFELLRVPREGRGLAPKLVTLKAIIGPGDTTDPVVTIMLPEES